MNPFSISTDHLSRRAFLKAALITAGGVAVPNWGGLFGSHAVADEVRRRGKRCILLWMAGGPSHLDTFDMKPGRPVAGTFRPIATNVPGLQVCEYLPRMARLADRLAVIRSMSTSDPDHSGGTYLMHTGYRREAFVRHPEIGAVVARYLGDSAADLPSFIQIAAGGGESSPNAGSGFLGPAYQPFRVGRAGRLPENTAPYLAPAAEERRADLLRAVDEGFAREQPSAAVLAHMEAQE